MLCWCLDAAVPRFYTKAEEKPDDLSLYGGIGRQHCKRVCRKRYSRSALLWEIVTETRHRRRTGICMQNYAKNGLAMRGLNEKIVEERSQTGPGKRCDFFLTMGSNGFY